MKRILLAGCALLAMCASAHATEDFCVRVKKTPDGFLAVRAKPTVHSAQIRSFGEGVILDADTRGIYNRPQWTHVFSTDWDGWVATKYVEVIKPDDCPDQPSPHVTNASISYVRDGNVFVRIGKEERQLTSSGRDSDAVLSPDAQFIAFTRSNRKQSDGRPDDCISGPQADELRRIKVDGSAEEVLVRGHASKEVSDQLCSFDQKQFTSTGDRLFFLSPAWVTSSAMHSYDFGSSKESYVMAANAFILLNFCADKDYRDALVVNQHRYRVGGGSYDWYWLYDQSGSKEMRLVGDYRDRLSVVSAMRRICN